MVGEFFNGPSRWDEEVFGRISELGIDELAELYELDWGERLALIEGPMAAANGRLPASSLASIPGGRLSKSAALRWNAMRQYIGKKHGVWIAPLGPNSSYRSYAGQLYYWNLYRSGRGNVAAYPGSSNHGWGNAVDVATQTMAYYIRRYGSMFGWSHAEGARVGEWWHFTYVGGGITKVSKPKPKPFAWLEPDERRWVLEYDRLKKANKDKKRRNVLRRVMAKRAVDIRVAAGRGSWNRHNRRKRYKSLVARSS